MRHPLFLVTLFVLSVASTAFGQAAGTSSGGSIWGKVTDETGGALPGVSVTAIAPTLIGSAEAITSDQGVYRFPSLPPGEFKLTFALPGFQTLVHEGMRLTSGFTATVDVQMKVSAVAEALSVVGRSPVVDTVNTRVQTTWTSDALASAPSSRDLWAILSESPAIQMQNRFDVGGSTAGTQTSYRAYGVAGQSKQVVEGMIIIEGHNSSLHYYDYASFEEVNVGAASNDAAMATPGVQVNWISKSGGNRYHGDLYVDFENESMATSNIDADQIALGVRPGSNRIDNISEVNATVGGFVVKDKLWWFGSYRRRQLEVALPNLPDTLFLTQLYNATGKLTYNLSKNNKLSAYVLYGLKKQPYRQQARAISGANAVFLDISPTTEQNNPMLAYKGEWNWTISNNLFLEARYATYWDHWYMRPHSSEPRREDLVTQLVTGGSYDWLQEQGRPQTTGALTYYKDAWGGSHTVKAGWELQQEYVRGIYYEDYPGNVVNVFRDGVPDSVYLALAPLRSENRLYWYGLYLTETMTRGPISVNAGVRFDRFRSAYPEQSHAATELFPALTVAAADNLKTWNALAPRVGISWKVNPRTVVKGNFGRYYHNPTTTVPSALNPNTSPQWNLRGWTDSNGNRQWDPGEQGSLQAARGAGATAVLSPTLKDPHTDEVAGWFEREVGTDFGVRTGVVYRRTNDVFLTTNSVYAFNPDAFTIPVTAVDPGADGRIGTGDDGELHLYNLNPSLLGQVVNTLMNAPDHSEEAITWEVSANRYLRAGWSLQGSYAVTWRDDYNPIQVTPNLPAQSDMLPISTAKVTASVEPGWDLRFTPVIRYQQGDPFARTVAVRLNYGSQTVYAEETGAERKEDVWIADLRAERKFALRHGMSVGLFFDAFNIFNSNAATQIISATGSSFLRPTNILAPRVFRLGAKFAF